MCPCCSGDPLSWKRWSIYSGSHRNGHNQKFKVWLHTKYSFFVINLLLISFAWWPRSVLCNHSISSRRNEKFLGLLVRGPGSQRFFFLRVLAVSLGTNQIRVFRLWLLQQGWRKDHQSLKHRCDPRPLSVPPDIAGLAASVTWWPEPVGIISLMWGNLSMAKTPWSGMTLDHPLCYTAAYCRVTIWWDAHPTWPLSKTWSLKHHRDFILAYEEVPQCGPHSQCLPVRGEQVKCLCATVWSVKEQVLGKQTRQRFNFGVCLKVVLMEHVKVIFRGASELSKSMSLTLGGKITSESH